MNKSDIVHLLAEKRGYRRCLVLRTPLTGPDTRIDPARFDVLHQIIYDPPGKPMAAGEYLGPQPDIIFLDPWHTYDASMRDLRWAWEMIPAGGAIVCHDCHPRNSNLDPDGWRDALEGKPWSGQTFVTWADFVWQHEGHRYLTVDTDYGVGVIIKGPAGCEINQEHEHTLANANPLINLITPEAFREVIHRMSDSTNIDAAKLMATKPTSSE